MQTTDTGTAKEDFDCREHRMRMFGGIVACGVFPGKVWKSNLLEPIMCLILQIAFKFNVNL